MELFEVYEADGSLLYVSSFLDRAQLDPGDFVVRRPWATSAKPTSVIPPGEPEAEVWECGPHMNAWGGHDARCRRVIPPGGAS